MSDRFQSGLQAYLKKEYQAALGFWQAAASAGDASAATNLGLMYLKGEGVAKDPAQAARLFEQAAGAGNASAAYNLGGLYENGLGVETSIEQAIAYYKKALEDEHSGAAYQLGTLHLEQLNDKPKAVAFFVRAYDRGHARAKMRLGVFDEAFYQTDVTQAHNSDFRTLNEAEQVACIEAALNHQVRAMLQKDGGDVYVGGVRMVDEVVDIYLCYSGACVGCSLASTATLAMIKEALSEAIDPAIRVFAL
jgi:TPR repeat protein